MASQKDSKKESNDNSQTKTKEDLMDNLKAGEVVSGMIAGSCNGACTIQLDENCHILIDVIEGNNSSPPRLMPQINEKETYTVCIAYNKSNVTQLGMYHQVPGTILVKYAASLVNDTMVNVEFSNQVKKELQPFITQGEGIQHQHKKGDDIFVGALQIIASPDTENAKKRKCN
jgi:hypothetical protein